MGVHHILLRENTFVCTSPVLQRTKGKSELCVCACAYTYTELHLAGWTPLFCLLCGVEAGQEAKSSPILLHVLLYYLVLQRLSQSPQTDFLAVCEKSHFRNIQLTYLCFQLLK